MKKRQRLLTDEQWELIAPLLPLPKQRRGKRGRPPTPNRACFEGILSGTIEEARRNPIRLM
jgi:transposase